MALSIESAPAGVYASATTNTVSLAVTNGNLALSLEAVRTGGTSVSSVIRDSQTFTLVNSQAGITDADRLAEIRRYYSPNTGTANSVLALSSSNKSAFTTLGISGADVNGTPLGTPAKANGTGATASINVPSAVGDIVFCVLAHSDGLAVTVLSGQTALFNLTNTSFVGAASYKAGEATQTNIGYSISGSQSYGWCIVGVAVKPAPAATPLALFMSNYRRRRI